MRILAIALLTLLSACASSQSGFTPTSQAAPPRPMDHEIEVFKGEDLPDRKYHVVATLDVHHEATHFIKREFDDAVEELKQQARGAGGDAIIQIVEANSSYLETSIYHVTAKAIRYED
jgi:hypothetical protein